MSGRCSSRPTNETDPANGEHPVGRPGRQNRGAGKEYAVEQILAIVVCRSIQPKSKVVMDKSTLLNSANATFLEALYEQYLESPGEISAELRAWFDGIRDGSVGERSRGLTFAFRWPKCR